jgi:hypothetical protein
MALVVLVFVFIGIYLIVGSHAVTPSVSLLADGGTLQNNASKQACSGATDGNCVMFNTCSQTVSRVAAAQTAISSAASGSTICMSSGSYGALSLSGSHTGNVTFEAIPSLDPNSAGKVTFDGITISGTYITVQNIYSINGISVSGNNDTVNHDDVTASPGNYGITISSSNGTAQNDTASYNKVHGMVGTNGVVSGSGCSSYGNDGDVLRLGPFENASFIGNDLYDNSEAPNANSCAGHTDTLQSYLGGSLTATGLTITKNYVHDETNVQGLAFLKDNDIQNVSITDNLSTRIASDGQTNGPAIDENSSVNTSVPNPPAYGITFEKNTYFGVSGYLEAGGSLPNPTATFDHNFINAFNTQGGAYSTFVHKYNDYQNGQPTEFTFKLDPTETILTQTPAFKCGSSCGNGTPAGDDYELSTNPNGIGIDWSPANQTYGPQQN